MTDYDITEIKTAKSNIPQPQASKDGILPRFPFSMMISGRSGSGKTNLLMNLMTKKSLYGGFFHYVIVYSPTAGDMDDSYKALNIPEENYIKDFSAETLEELIDSRKDLIEKKGIEWVGQNSRVVIILDDIIANRKFLESPTALKLFALLRHYLVSIITLMQSYNKLPRPLRLNANALAIFPASQSEVEVLLKEVTPSGISKRDFENVIDYATQDRYDFLYINNHADVGKRIRRNLNEVIDLDKFNTKKNKN
jgi:hypothetical protein